MNTYQIADLEKFTGIKAHTIRIWEQRYNLINPHRTSTNIRFYDDEHLRKLLNISTLLASGNKISKIAILTSKQIDTQIKEIQKNASENIVYIDLINNLILSMLAFNESDFNKTLSAAITRYGLYETTLNVIYPFLVRTGILWASREAMPVQEHFANNIIRRKIITAIDNLEAPSKKTKTFLLFLPPNEWHETGLLLADYMIREKGYKTIYLGQNVPANDLNEAIKKTTPTHVFTIFITRQNVERIQKMLLQLSETHKKCTFLISGSNYFSDSVNKISRIKFLQSPSDLTSLL